MKGYEIPLGFGSQKLRITLNKISYVFVLTWRVAGFYTLDIFKDDESVIARSVALLTGANIIEAHQHTIRGQLLVWTQNGLNPTYESLGVTTKLYWIDP